MDNQVARNVQLNTLKQWALFATKCLGLRVDPDQFESYVVVFQSKHPLPPVVIAEVFLRPQLNNHDCLDPRVPQYIQVLTKLDYVDTPSILKGLYKYSTSHKHTQISERRPDDEEQSREEETTPRWGNSYGAEEVMFYRLTKAVAQGTAIHNTEDALEVAKIVSKWMTLFTNAAAAFAVDVMGPLPGTSQARDEMESARAAFVALLLGVCESQIALKALSRPQAKATRKAMSESLSNFVPTIMTNAGQIATRLDLFRTNTLASFEPADEKKRIASPDLDHFFDPAVDLEQFAIPEIPIANSRAGLYIYLNAALVAQPLIDDSAFFSYLNNKYQGDLQSTTIDLILASFDVLANAVFRNEGNKTAHLLRSYLMNKLPLQIGHLSKHMYHPLTAEYCITEALSHVDTNAFPTLSSMFDESRNNNPFTDSVREEFCWACCLHGLLQERSVETILGETPYQSLPSQGRYTRENLVAQCASDPERVQSLVEEMDNMDGNVGAVCHALVEILGQFCLNKDTVALKNLCGLLTRRPLSLDVILLFEKPVVLLQPLIEMLDNWKYDEDQGEYQPVYEDFGSVLLLVLTFSYRYNMSPADLGIKSPTSSVAKVISQNYQSRSFEDLSDQEKKHLDGWIRGLFDQEAGGLTDDLISSCPPQDFYLLVPTLFQNIVTAFGTGHLSDESLKSGVEYLVDTFLLPSLVPAITYLSNALWVDTQNQKAIIKILQLVLQPSAISSEASTMLSSVLNIVAKPLEHSLRAYQRQDPKSQEIEPLLKAIKSSIPLSRRTGAADHAELEAWTGTPHGGLTAALTHTIQGCVQWSLQPGMNVTPTSYTHRQFLSAQKMLGAKRVLRIICWEIKRQTQVGSASIAYDVAIALICAPDVTNIPPPPTLSFLDDSNALAVPAQRRLTLREALKSEAEDCRKLHKADPLMAEIVVRLHRQVEAQLVMTQVEEIQADAMLQSNLGLGLTGDPTSLDDAMAAAAAAGAGQSNAMVVDDVGLNLGIGALGGDLGLGDGAGGSLDLAADEIFGGLSASGDFDWDTGMDLT